MPETRATRGLDSQNYNYKTVVFKMNSRMIYDALGRLVRREEQGTVTDYLYNQNNLISVITTNETQQTAATLYSYNEFGQLVREEIHLPNQPLQINYINPASAMEESMVNDTPQNDNDGDEEYIPNIRPSML